MAHAITLNDYAAPANGLFARLRQAIADYRVYVATRNELEALSDHELADIDVTRANIADIAREAAAHRA